MAVVPRAECANTLPVRERAVELCMTEVVSIGQAEFDERVVAALLRNFRIFDEALLRAEYVVLAA